MTKPRKDKVRKLVVKNTRITGGWDSKLKSKPLCVTNENDQILTEQTDTVKTIPSELANTVLQPMQAKDVRFDDEELQETSTQTETTPVTHQ